MTPADQQLFQGAVVSLQVGALDEAERGFAEFLRRNPNHFGALNLLGVLLVRQARYLKAESVMRRAIGVDARSDATFHNYGMVLKALNRPKDALDAFGKAIAINPSAAESWNCRGAVLIDLNRLQDAIGDFDKAVALNPHFADAFYNKGRALLGLKRYDEALASFNQSLAIRSSHSETWVFRGVALFALERLAEALASYEKALALQPNHLMALNNQGNVLRELRQFEAALASFDRALSVTPDYAEIVCNRGFLLFDMGRYDEAVNCLGRALALNPDLKYLPGRHLYAKMFICDWSNFDRDCQQLISAVRAGCPASMPFDLLCYASNESLQLSCTRSWVQRQSFVPSQPFWRGTIWRNDRIKIAYLSADFRNHAMATLITELIERHNRAQFEVFGISFGVDDRSDARARLIKAFDQFHDVRFESDHDVAKLMNDLKIDIAIDLNGYTQGSRPEILGFRPAPIQVNYLGYPATMGVDFIDYILVDAVVVPFDFQTSYAEKIVHLPDCYGPTDSKQLVARGVPARGDVGLPTGAFVFCSFNESYKITAPMFDIWMYLLRAVEGSVLWLMYSNDTAVANLRREAEARGVEGDRLIFAPRLGRAEHLARISLADLFLNTHPVNAGATAIDALSVGLPIVTYLGETFVQRVTASLLHAVGLPELVVRSLKDYEALALRLARDPVMLAELKARLVRNRVTYPLFNIERFTRHIEAAYKTMWEIWQRGESPQNISVEPIAFSG